MKILILFINIILFLIPTSVAQEYNLSCIFTPKIQLVNISLDVYGANDYFPYLVENNDAFYSVKLITVGNWSQYNVNINHRTVVKCDDDIRAIGTTFEINTYQSPNGTVMSDFIYEGEFYIPENKKHCNIILTEIRATNQSWERESGCEYGISNCFCLVNGLSGYRESLSREVLTKEQFFAKKGVEIAQKQYERDRENIIIGAIIGGFFAFSGILLSNKLIERRLKKKRFLKACEDVYEKMVKCFYSINEATDIYPKTLNEYKSKVGIPKEKFENSLNTNSIFFDKNLSNALEDVRLTFRETTRAILLSLPKKEIPKNIESYPKNYSVINWPNLNNSFEKARMIIRKRLE